MKKVGLILGGIVVIVVVAILALTLLVDVNQYRTVIEARLEQQLGRDVTLGAMSLGLLPLRIQVDEPVISEDPDFGERPPFVRAESLAVRVSLLPLIRRDIRIQSLELDRPSVELVRNAAGMWNFSTLGSDQPETDPAMAGTAPAQTSGAAFTLDLLVVSDGQVAVSQLGATETRSVYDHIDLTVNDYAAGQPFSFDITAHIQGEGAQELRVVGEGGPVSVENPLDTPFRGTLGLEDVGVEGLTAFLQTDALSVASGALSGETEIQNESGTLIATGSLSLEDARFNDVEVGYPISMAYEAQAALARKFLTIQSATLRLGETPMAVSGTVNAATSPASLDLEIESGEVSISEIARLASAFGVAFPPDATVDGRVSTDLEVSGSTTQPVLTGTIAGRGLRISGNSIPQPVGIEAIDLALSPTVIRSNEFDARSGDTTATARFALEDYASENPRIDAEVRAPGATLPEIQSIARAYGITGLDQIEGQGGLDLDLRASGPLDSIGSDAIIRALDGDINLDFSPLRASGFDASRELGIIGGFTSGSGTEGITEILRLSGQIAIRNGIAQTENLMAELGIGNISATGTADLATETLDLKGMAVLSKAFSDTIGGTSVAGYLSTALANSAGEIVIPITISGTFTEPQFAPDSNMFVQMQAERLLPSFDDPGAALSGLLNAFSGQSDDSDEEESQGEDAPEQDRPEDAIREILGGFFGGRNAEEPQ
jgi:uncharacterized protein involved in outer membrane biogenesis